MGKDYGDGFSTGMIVGAAVVFAIFLVVALLNWNTQTLSSDTVNDVCRQLTGNQTAVGHGLQNKLICELPSFDSTQNIVIRSNSDKSED